MKVMTESELNSMINTNFGRYGFSHKISDQPRKNATPRPFDGFSIYDGKVFFWETKILDRYKAFPLSMIKDHQLESLLSIVNIKAFKDTTMKSVVKGRIYPLIILGIVVDKKNADLFFFDINIINNFKIVCKTTSIEKWSLLDLRKNGKYLPMKEGKFDARKIVDKIIY